MKKILFSGDDIKTGISKLNFKHPHKRISKVKDIILVFKLYVL